MINMKNITKYTLGVIALAFIAMPSLALAGTTQGARVGLLTCKTVPGSALSLVIHSTEDVKCTFKGNAGGTEHYKGETGVGLGFDISFNRETTMVYAVMSANVKAGNHQLAGKYFGGGGSATIGAGVGAQALIGGGSKNVSLQPVALSGSTGAGVSGGVTYLYLEAD
ncbi:MAG: DUF992 domain-containing protein [Mariprofundaceae bacterium]|nr:DUF992 domain-containing protein [Mariprofundaceae bacterium]